MRTVGLYGTSLVVGGILAAALYVAVSVADDHRIQPPLLAASIAIGCSAALAILQYSKTRAAEVYHREGFSALTLAWIQLRGFFGIGAGMVIGLLASWLLVYPFSILFGYPFSENEQHATRARVFGALALLITVTSAFVVGRYFARRAIGSIGKQTGSENRGMNSRPT